MDHQEFAQLLGNYGEFVGAIGVVGTLIYLAVQVRHSRQAMIENTRAVRSSTYEAYNQSGSAWSDFIAEYASQLTTIQELSSLDYCTPEQQMIYTALSLKTFNMMEATFLHHRAGSLDDDVFEARLSGFRNYLESAHLLREAWRRGPSGLSREFRDFMETLVPDLQHDGI